ncbi:MAG TPA: M23 family metallopeptidase [Flavitalea sp.]|nr:M23 family metallopeptidase [Flavitalea sp.]
MKKFSIIYSACIFVSLASPAQLADREIRDLKNGHIANDTSYIYWLPFQPGKSYFLVQGWESKHSHKGELLLDFKMRPGTKIFAAREGKVVDIKQDSDKGGVKGEFLSEGNHIIIQHTDSSYSGYWHLEKDGVRVHVDDQVVRGQYIGRSGNTGYSAFPHLHFYVYKNDGEFKTLPTRFVTTTGVRYLRPGQYYKSSHQ